MEDDVIKNIVIGGYRSILKREPDPGGLENYIQEIKNGLNVDRFLEILRISAEYDSKFRANLPFGWLSGEDDKLLLDMSNNKICLEIGTFLGRSAIIMCINAIKVYTVDIFEDLNIIKDPENSKHYQEQFEKFPHDYEQIKNFLSKYNNITVLKRGEIEDVDTLLIPDKLDMVFIDGDHSTMAVIEDVNLVLPLIKTDRATDGTILLHDVYSPGWETVRKAYDILANDGRFDCIDFRGKYNTVIGGLCIKK